MYRVSSSVLLVSQSPAQNFDRSRFRPQHARWRRDWNRLRVVTRAFKTPQPKPLGFNRPKLQITITITHNHTQHTTKIAQLDVRDSLHGFWGLPFFVFFFFGVCPSPSLHTASPRVTVMNKHPGAASWASAPAGNHSFRLHRKSIISIAPNNCHQHKWLSSRKFPRSKQEGGKWRL